MTDDKVTCATPDCFFKIQKMMGKAAWSLVILVLTLMSGSYAYTTVSAENAEGERKIIREQLGDIKAAVKVIEEASKNTSRSVDELRGTMKSYIDEKRDLEIKQAERGSQRDALILDLYKRLDTKR